MTHFKFYANCKLIRGTNRSIIYDLQRHRKHVFDMIVYDVFSKASLSSVTELKSRFKEHVQGIEKFIDFFVKNNLGFLVEDIDCFPELDEYWDSPSLICNSIIELDRQTDIQFKKIISELRKCGCNDVQFRVLSDNGLDCLIRNAQYFNSYDFISTEILISEHVEFTEFIETELFGNIDSIVSVLDYNLNETRYVSTNPKVFALNESIWTSYIERYNVNGMNVSMDVFMESKFYNLGLNRKVCFTRNGLVKNYLSHKESFGSIYDQELRDIIEGSSIKKLWNINNDKIEKCKNCIYRYCCLSNSDIVKREGKFYKSEYCHLEHEDI